MGLNTPQKFQKLLKVKEHNMELALAIVVIFILIKLILKKPKQKTKRDNLEPIKNIRFLK